MAALTSRAELKAYCLRRLGAPMVSVDIDDDQLEDRIDDAIQYFQSFHSDGQKKYYVRHEITANDITNEYITVPEGVMQVARVLPIPLSTSSDILFDIEYHIRLEEIWNLKSGTNGIQGYMQTMQYLTLLDDIFNRHETIVHSRYDNKLYIYMDWSNIVAGKFLVMEVFGIVDPEVATDMYNDRHLKAYATAMLEMQWGQNLSKFEGVVMLGGVTLNGQQIYDKGFAKIEQLEEDIRLSQELPPDFIFG